MEITSCERYVMDELRAAQAENRFLREELAEMRRREKDRGAEVGIEPSEVEMYKVNEPFETAYLTVEDAYAYSSSENGLDMTAAEIREALETDDGLREVCEKRVGWAGNKIVDVELRVWPYQFRSLNNTYVLDIYGDEQPLIMYVSDGVEPITVMPGERVKRPEPEDTQEKIDADAEKSFCEYFGHGSGICKEGGVCEAHGSDEPCRALMIRDLLRRQRELCERGAR